MKTIWYGVDDSDQRFCIESPSPVDLHRPIEASDAAQDCAQDLFNNHDGWEAAWPLVIVLYESESGPEIARFDVECEAVPQFTARKTEALRAPQEPAR